MLVLRAHHLFCIQGYQGYGYDETFSKNMDNISDLIKEDKIDISICNHSDDICEKCPNLKNNICKDIENNEKIVQMDNYVLDILDNDKVVFNSNQLFTHINKIINENDIIQVCGECTWVDKCLFYQEKILKKNTISLNNTIL